MFNRLINLFRKKTDSEREEELVDEIVREEDVDDTREQSLVSVILYTPDPNDNNVPSMNVIVDEFSNEMIPEIKSIIWITDEDGAMRPFKVIRYDYIQNGSEYDSARVYIVVEPATYSDVLPNPKFSM